MYTYIDETRHITVHVVIYCTIFYNREKVEKGKWVRITCIIHTWVAKKGVETRFIKGEYRDHQHA